MINTGGSIPSNVFKTIKYPPGYLGKPIVEHLGGSDRAFGGVQSSSGGGIPVAVAEVASSGDVSDAIAEATPVPHR